MFNLDINESITHYLRPSELATLTSHLFRDWPRSKVPKVGHRLSRSSCGSLLAVLSGIRHQSAKKQEARRRPPVCCDVLFFSSLWFWAAFRLAVAENVVRRVMASRNEEGAERVLLREEALGDGGVQEEDVRPRAADGARRSSTLPSTASVQASTMSSSFACCLHPLAKLRADHVAL
eukprot:scaffold85563_cov26-Tisochrysis_lutea.AAC.2